MTLKICTLPIELWYNHLKGGNQLQSQWINGTRVAEARGEDGVYQLEHDGGTWT